MARDGKTQMELKNHLKRLEELCNKYGKDIDNKGLSIQTVDTYCRLLQTIIKIKERYPSVING